MLPSCNPPFTNLGQINKNETSACICNHFHFSPLIHHRLLRHYFCTHEDSPEWSCFASQILLYLVGTLPVSKQHCLKDIFPHRRSQDGFFGSFTDPWSVPTKIHVPHHYPIPLKGHETLRSLTAPGRYLIHKPDLEIESNAFSSRWCWEQATIFNATR